MEPQDGKGASAVHWKLWLAGVGVVLLAVVAMACHPDTIHLATVHSGAGDEEWCVFDSSDSGDADQFISKIREALWDNGHEEDWDSRATVFFVSAAGISNNCNDLTSQQQEDTELVYTVTDDIPTHTESRGGAENHGDGYKHYPTFVVYIKGDELLGSDQLRRHLINHETGHALGLVDPTPNPNVVDYTAEHCLVYVKVEFLGKFFVPRPVYSIMHSAAFKGGPSCDPVVPFRMQWPTSVDLYSFDENVVDHPK